jgi:hypothetical protein
MDGTGQTDSRSARETNPWLKSVFISRAKKKFSKERGSEKGGICRFLWSGIAFSGDHHCGFKSSGCLVHEADSG